MHVNLQRIRACTDTYTRKNTPMYTVVTAHAHTCAVSVYMLKPTHLDVATALTCSTRPTADDDAGAVGTAHTHSPSRR